MSKAIEQQNTETIKSYLKKLEALDVDGFVPYYAPDLDYRVYSNSKYVGRFDLAVLKAALPGWAESAAGLRLQIWYITAQEDRVCVFARGTSKTYDNVYHYLYRVRNGQIYAVDEVYVHASEAMVFRSPQEWSQ
jgi:ketosteroid isomerase-like protein